MDRDPAEEPGAAGAPLAPGLYLVATPIGNARDVGLRALDVLKAADVLAAEDTRHTGKLLAIHGIRRGRLVPYHDHTGAAQRPRLLAALAEGRSVALVSDAGTPLVADPGWRLAAEAIAAGHAVTAVPGASALLAALAVAGLPTDRFLFAGFLPPRRPARRRALAELAERCPPGLLEALGELAADRGRPPRAEHVGHVRELTKRFEETRRAPLGELAAAYAAGPEPKGEVVVLAGAPVAAPPAAEALDAALAAALDGQSVRDAAAAVAAALGLPRREVYARALELSRR